MASESLRYLLEGVGYSRNLTGDPRPSSLTCLQPPSIDRLGPDILLEYEAALGTMVRKQPEGS
jgi:hypothetical protein